MTALLKRATTTLPRHVKPFHGETMASHLKRLADANRVDPKALRRYIAESRLSGPVPVDRLATVSGVPATAFEWAIADLDGRSLASTNYYRSIAIHPQLSGPACQLCAAARGIIQPVISWKPPEKVICLHHRRWTGSGSTSIQPSLHRQPDILEANRRHLRLVRRFGRDKVTMGFEIAPRSAGNGVTSASTTRTSPGGSQSSTAPTGTSPPQTRPSRPQPIRKSWHSRDLSRRRTGTNWPSACQLMRFLFFSKR